jgi:hypothetical protein
MHVALTLLKPILFRGQEAETRLDLKLTFRVNWTHAARGGTDVGAILIATRDAQISRKGTTERIFIQESFINGEKEAASDYKRETTRCKGKESKGPACLCIGSKSYKSLEIN